MSNDITRKDIVRMLDQRGYRLVVETMPVHIGFGGGSQRFWMAKYRGDRNDYGTELYRMRLNTSTERPRPNWGEMAATILQELGEAP